MKIAFSCLLLAIAIGSGCDRSALGEKVAVSLREQEALNEAARPLLDAVVTKKVKVGDTVERAKEILAAAGLESHLETFSPELRSSYRTGQGCGFTITLSLDTEKRVSKIDVRPFYTSP